MKLLAAAMTFLFALILAGPSHEAAAEWPESVWSKPAKSKSKQAKAKRAKARKRSVQRRRRSRRVAARRKRARRRATRQAAARSNAAAAASSGNTDGKTGGRPKQKTGLASTGRSALATGALASLQVDFGNSEPATAPTSRIAPPTTRPWGELQAGPSVASLNRTPAAKPQQPVQPWHWRITKTHWSASDEAGYEEFVRKIGESKCRSVNSCLKSAKANPAFHASNPRRMFFYADCADLPYMLRAYYAWKKGLPFSYASEVSPLGRSRDIRYTLRGNAVTKRRDLVDTPLDARRIIPRIMYISSAQYRIPPLHKGRLPSDHYPVAITPKSVRPGTIIYDPNGHVVVVYKVTKQGRIRYIDTHPDNSLTRGTYGRKFVRAKPTMGAGFKRWRPLELVGATRLKDGSYKGGRITHAADATIPDWSVEQFYGTAARRPKHWRAARFSTRGKRVNYYDFVRLRLAAKNFQFDPLEETGSMMRALCADIKYRVDAVNIAIGAGIQRQPQPHRLPRNIYGTDGDWETYSTPSRDARLKTSFKELRDEVARFIKISASGGSHLKYDGDNLSRDLLQIYKAEAKACPISYTKSNGVAQVLTFQEVSKRLFRLSFDPHHCIERRWGAGSAEEIASCKDGATKRNWYKAQKRLRNQIDRKYDQRMDFYLAGLRKSKPGSGVDTPPDIDVLSLLQGSARKATLADAGEHIDGDN